MHQIIMIKIDGLNLKNYDFPIFFNQAMMTLSNGVRVEKSLNFKKIANLIKKQIDFVYLGLC